jgi:flagellar basal-body rod protein FlgG
MLSKLRDLDNSAGNLANVNTIGYKANRSNFQELMDKVGYDGTLETSTQVLMNQGTIKQTGNQLDVAIEGEGFFGVTYAAGKTGYTRNGEFSVDGQGRLVTASGYPLVWTGTIPTGTEEVEIQENGVVRARVGDTWAQAGTIQISRFINPTALQLNGNNVYVETTNSGKATVGTPGSTNYGLLKGQSLEQSTTDIGREMTHLITLQRGFQLSTRVFQSTDTMISQAIHVRKA